jgi:hypothetical protein
MYTKLNNKSQISLSGPGYTPCKETGGCLVRPASWPLPLLPTIKTITDMVQEASTASPALMYPDCLTKTFCL